MDQIPPSSASSALAPHPTEEVLPLAAVCATDIKREDEIVNGLLREPDKPKEIVIVTKPDMPVPPLPMDLMELLVS